MLKVVRKKCADRFLKEILLPHLARGQEIKKEKFIKLLVCFKRKFCSANQDTEIDDFSLTQELDRLLFALTLLEEPQSIETSKRYNEAYDFLSEMLKKYPEDLYPL